MAIFYLYSSVSPTDPQTPTSDEIFYGGAFKARGKLQLAPDLDTLTRVSVPFGIPFICKSRQQLLLFGWLILLSFLAKR